MPIPKKVTSFLEKHGVDYEEVKHKTVYTAYDLSRTLKHELKEIAKTLAVKADKKYALVVLPATHRADLDKLKKLLQAKKLEIVRETHLNKIFKMKPGAIVPFANLHGMPVYLEKSLLNNKVIVVSGGSYTESLKLKAKDLAHLGAEVLGVFGAKQAFKKPKKPVKKSVKKPVKKRVKKTVKKRVKKGGKKKR